MFNKLKIGTKVVVLVLSLVFLSVILESVISYYRNKDSVRTNYYSKLLLMTDFYEDNLAKKFHTVENDLKILRQEIPSEQILILNRYVYHPQLDTAKLWVDHFKETYFDPIQTVGEFNDIYLLNSKGDILYEHNTKQTLGHQFRNIDHDIIDIHKPHFYVNKPIWEKGNFYFYVSLPIKNEKDETIAILVANIHTDKIIAECIPRNVGFGKKIEFLIFRSYKNEIYNLNPSTVSSKLIVVKSDDDPILLASNGQNGFGEYSDSRNQNTLAVWKHYDDFGVSTLVKIDASEAFYELGDFNLITLLTGILILFVSLILSLFFARVLSVPMFKLKKVLGLVSNGVLPKELNTPLEDETGQMVNIVNKIVKSLKGTAAFAHAIGEGDFDTKFKPISNKDILGHALVNMRESLQKADKKDVLRNWIVSGIAEIGEILRENDSLSELGDEILEYLCSRIDSIQGAFYIVNDDDPENQFIETRASYAFHKKKHLQGNFKFAEGLVGQAAIEKDIIIRTEIPDDYMFVTSGLLEDKKPNAILIVPLVYNETVYGLVELASFSEFNEDKVQFMLEVSEIIARTIFNIKVNENTKNLLSKSQHMSSELQVQQEELRQNALEMEKTQLELQSSNSKLEQQITEVNNAHHRIQALLQNASEVISIYDENQVVQYVSPSVETILGYREKDLVNKPDIQHLDESGRVEFQEMFDKLLKDEAVQLTIQVQYFKKTGDKIWLEATGKNLLNNPAIGGIIVNYRDITEKIRAEEEERKRGQMQALSENSPDLITRVSKDKTFFYMNPAISLLTGRAPEEFLNQSIESLDLPETVIEEISIIVDKVVSEKAKTSKEMIFPSIQGDRVMQLNAIPEIDPDNDLLESVLLVSHDITEQKQIENEVKQKNKKINDSINYAEMIQEAVLPNTGLLQHHLPNSFIYFKPRDVVSGDFPWYYKKGDDVYVAAVDCTGHGVPGALISLVGFFLLNNIIENSEVADAAELLDLLDNLVTKTFRQDEESSKIKDGMDIALCKVNLKNNTIDYAGANRPLVWLCDGEIKEIKGDKFPIGGGSSYTNKSNFTNHQVTVKEGDSVFFFSDGFPDQFGGENNMTKFGPSRIKEVIKNNNGKSIQDTFVDLDDNFQNWKTNTKQTDDVLMIGIKF